MFTLIEKKVLLKALKRKSGLFNKMSKEEQEVQFQLIEKLEQMIRNEEVNKKYL